MYDLVIRGGTVIDSIQSKTEDLAVRDGVVVERGECRASAMVTISADGQFVLPGGVDAHVHLNEPGRTEWEGFATGTAALAAGGCTTFIDMPLNSSPPLLNATAFHAKAAAFAQHSRLDGAFWGGATPKNLHCLKELADCGVIGFKAFMSYSGFDEFPCSDARTLHEAMTQAADYGLPVAVHAESERMTSQLARELQAAGKSGIRDYLDSRPIAAEVEAIGTALEIAARTQCALHIVHVSSAEGLRQIAAAKEKGSNVTAETCAHYLLMNENDLFRLGALAKCAPPLRAETERKELWDALLQGMVDTLGSDHSPSPPEMKQEMNFFKVWGGIACAQHAWLLLLETALVEQRLSPSRFVHLASKNVADRFRIPGKGDLQVGNDADIVLVARINPHTITKEELLTRHKTSAYVGRSTRLQVISTVAGGEVIFGPQVKSRERAVRLLSPK